MEQIEISAKTVEDAIQKALTQLNVSLEEVDITVLKEGKHGILGMGGEEAMIRVVRKTPSPNVDENVATAKNVLETILSKMDIVATVTAQTEPFVEEEGRDEVAPIIFDIQGEDLGILIGRQGQTMSCLQYIVRLIMAQQTKEWLPIMIDVEGYRQRRYKALQALAQRLAAQVKQRGIPFTLEPMPAYERRIVHLALADDPEVTTQSTGEGDARKVVIYPKKPSSRRL